MKKGAIIYKGKYGATRQYAQWLGQELNLPCVNADAATDQAFNDYDFVILGSSVYYGRLLLRAFLARHTKALKTKKVFIFIVCATPDSDEKEQNKILKDNIPDFVLKMKTTFFLPGKLAVKKVSLFDRIMLLGAALLAKDPKKKKLLRNGFDTLSKDNLIDLVIAVKAFLMKTS